LFLDTKWKQQGITIAGGNGEGNKLNQLAYPHGIYIDEYQTIYIADSMNNRIVEWKSNANKGRVVASRNGIEDQTNQLSYPIGVIIDAKNDCFIIADNGNRRVIRWSRQNNTNKEIIIDDIACVGLIMDNNGYLYVSDQEKNEVRRWKKRR
jgi:sugar lactone lactonase YvrE